MPVVQPAPESIFDFVVQNAMVTVNDDYSALPPEAFDMFIKMIADTFPSRDACFACMTYFNKRILIIIRFHIHSFK